MSFFNFSNSSLIIALFSINWLFFSFNCLFILSFLLIISCWFDICFSYCSIFSDNFFLSSLNCKISFSRALFFSNNWLYFWLILFFSFSKSLKLSAFFCRDCILDLIDNKFISFNFNFDISIFKLFISFSFSLFDTVSAFFSLFIFTNSLLIIILSSFFFSNSWFNLFIRLLKLSTWLIISFWFDICASFCFNLSIKFSFSSLIIEFWILKFLFSSNNCL